MRARSQDRGQFNAEGSVDDLMMSPTLSTPASPTPLTEDGDDLLLELRGFLTRMSSGPAAGTVLNRFYETNTHFMNTNGRCYQTTQPAIEGFETM